MNGRWSWLGTNGCRGSRGWAPALPGLILLSLLVVATALLVAGYGVPVGLGLMIGLVLGVVVGLWTGLWLGVRGRGRSMTIGSMNISPTIEEPPMGTLDFFRDIEQVQRVDHGALVRVVPGGAVAVGAGATVELIALEIRTSGAVAHLAAAADPPNGRLGSFARVDVDDDLGTTYVAAASVGNGSPDRTRFEVRLAPAPPAAATSLRIQVDEFVDPFPLRSQAALLGPWTLTVGLADSA